MAKSFLAQYQLASAGINPLLHSGHNSVRMAKISIL